MVTTRDARGVVNRVATVAAGRHKIASDALSGCADVPPDAFDRAYLSERVPRLEALLLKMRNSKAIKVACVGGSFTAGQECFLNESKRHRYLARDPSCAWPKRLETQLRSQPLRAKLGMRAKLLVLNLGRGGVGTKEWAMENVERSSTFKNVDLVIFEGSLNDGDSSQKTVHASSLVLFSSMLNLPSKPAVISLEVTRAADVASSGMARFSRPCRDLHSLGQPGLRYCTHWWSVPEWRAPAKQALGVPTVSFRDAFWPELDRPADRAVILGFRSEESYFNGTASTKHHLAAHPGPEAHRRVACLIGSALARSSDLLRAAEAASLPVPLRETAAATAVSVADASSFLGRCNDPITKLLPPLTTFAPALTSRPSAPSAHVGWWYGEDVVGNEKPGWNANKSGALIAFPVTVGPEKRIIISRLRSYAADMADAQASLWPVSLLEHGNWTQVVSQKRAGKRQDSWLLPGLWDQPISIPDHHTQSVQSTPGQYLLIIESLRARWRATTSKSGRSKILSIATC